MKRGLVVVTHNKLKSLEDKTMNLNNMETLMKFMELSDRVLMLIDEQAEDTISRSDLQGCVEAIIMDAMNYIELPTQG